MGAEAVPGAGPVAVRRASWTWLDPPAAVSVRLPLHLSTPPSSFSLSLSPPRSAASSAGSPGSSPHGSGQLSLCNGGGSNVQPGTLGGSLDPAVQIFAPVAALQEYDTKDSPKLFLVRPAGRGALCPPLPPTPPQSTPTHPPVPCVAAPAQLDTPGPNEAGEEGLRLQVERLLGGVDAVLYLLDYTKLKTQEEAAMFLRLKAVNPQLVRRLAQRLFFVVNKVDTMATSEGQGPEETRRYVAELVTRQLNLEGFHLAPEQVGNGGKDLRCNALL